MPAEETGWVVGEALEGILGMASVAAGRTTRTAGTSPLTQHQSWIRKWSSIDLIFRISFGKPKGRTEPCPSLVGEEEIVGVHHVNVACGW
jgi:hypothetical protein